jgi:hypothetical protein
MGTLDSYRTRGAVLSQLAADDHARSIGDTPVWALLFA